MTATVGVVEFTVFGGVLVNFFRHFDIVTAILRDVHEMFCLDTFVACACRRILIPDDFLTLATAHQFLACAKEMTAIYLRDDNDRFFQWPVSSGAHPEGAAF